MNGWKVNILGGDRKKSSYEHVVLNGYRDMAVWIYQYKTIMNGNKEWEITYCLFYFNFKFMF